MTDTYVHVIAGQTSGGGSGVTSFNTRTGAVTSQTGDYGVAQVTGAAPLASPTFTGTPAAPTPSSSTNTTQIATTAFTQAAIVAAFIMPTQTVIKTGSGAYNPPTSPRSPKYLRVRGCGGGGGAQGSQEGLVTAGNGSDGGDTTFVGTGVSITAGGGKGATSADVGAPGVCTISTTFPGISYPGQYGSEYMSVNYIDDGFTAIPLRLDFYNVGGVGGNSLFNGAGTTGIASLDATPNTGCGGSGPSLDAPSFETHSTLYIGGQGGGGAGWFDYFLPAQAYTFSIGDGGDGGAGTGTRGTTGGKGGSGVLIIDEFYQ